MHPNFDRKELFNQLLTLPNMVDLSYADDEFPCIGYPTGNGSWLKFWIYNSKEFFSNHPEWLESLWGKDTKERPINGFWQHVDYNDIAISTGEINNNLNDQELTSFIQNKIENTPNENKFNQKKQKGLFNKIINSYSDITHSSENGVSYAKISKNNQTIEIWLSNGDFGETKAQWSLYDQNNPLKTPLKQQTFSWQDADSNVLSSFKKAVSDNLKIDIKLTQDATKKTKK